MSAPFDRILVLDWETFWDSKNGYTLSKITTEEYIRDPRFQAFGIGLKWYKEDLIRWVRPEQLRLVFSKIDWSRTAVMAQNAMFDAAILSWVYDVHPAFIFDTLSMARAIHGAEAGNSLAKLAHRYGLPAKGNAVHTTDGLSHLTMAIEQELADYCKHDVWLCEAVFDKLMAEFGDKGYPRKELQLIDMTIKMFTEPELVLDPAVLTKAIEEEATYREGLLAKLNISEAELASNPKFAKALSSLGVVPPTKKKRPTLKTPNPVGVTYAFAKNDAAFQVLLAHENEAISTLCEARIAAKSTQARTRAQTFLDISGRGTLPVALNYYAAGPGRFGGTQGTNLQNLKRGGALRQSIRAPKGKVLVVSDLGQIEPRCVAWQSDYHELLEIFRLPKSDENDSYAMFGRGMFGVPDMTKTSHPILRQSAKSAMIGAGYGLGWASFAGQLLVGFLSAPPKRYDKQDFIALGGNKQHLQAFFSYAPYMERMAEIPHACTDEELFVHCVSAKIIIDRFRAAAKPVVDYWNVLDEIMRYSLAGGDVVEYKCFRFEKERVVLPNGMFIRYPDLQPSLDAETGKLEWTYARDNGRAGLYSGKICQNLTEGVGRITMTDAMLRIQKRYPVKLTVHDEVAVLAPEEEAEEARAWVHEQMVKPSAIMPGIPLIADTNYGTCYGDIK